MQADASIQAANARLIQVRVQSALGLGGRLLEPSALLAAAVEGEGGADEAVDILASSSREFRLENRSVMLAGQLYVDENKCECVSICRQVSRCPS